MKKKGLIISTIVMVVVLIASLTTATYAWFNASAEVSVEQITLNTTAAEGLLIGVHKSNASTSSSVFQDYTNGDLTWGLTSPSTYNGTWTGGEDGFGLTVNSDQITSLTSTYGVGYTTTALNNGKESSDPEYISIAANNWFKAQGNGSTRTNMDNTTIQVASANSDFIVLDLGVTPSQNNLVKQAWVSIKVTVPNYANPGMGAAVKIGYAVNNATAVTYSDLTFVDAFNGMTQTNGYDASAIDQGALDTTNNTWTYSLELYNNATAMTRNSNIGRVYLVIYLDGDDDACIISNLGTGCTIDIQFGWDRTNGAKTFTKGVLADA